MPSNYPSGIDSYPERTTDHFVMPDDVNGLQDAVVAIENELGTTPSGSFDSVAERLSAIQSELENARLDNQTTPVQYESLKEHLDAIHQALASIQIWALPETPSGTIDGSNTTFTLSETPVAGSEMIFKNGAFLVPESDYVINADTITLSPAPTPGDTLRAIYRIA